MKRRHTVSGLAAYGLLALYTVAIVSLTAYVATKYATPCVCVLAQMRTIN